MSRKLITAWIAILVCGPICQRTGDASLRPPSADDPPYDATDMYVVETVEGWKVLVNKRLHGEAQQTMREQTIRALSDQLFRISRVMPSTALEKLRQVPIWIELEHPKHPCMCYHPSPEWLRMNNMNPEKAGAVEIANCQNFLTWTVDQPWMVLHELAHAYHDRVVGSENAEIHEAYDNAVKSKSYDSVLHIRGEQRRHYGLNNDFEYFAESTEAYFGTNDFYPFVRAEVRQHDPTMFDLLERLWGVPRPESE